MSSKEFNQYTNSDGTKGGHVSSQAEIGTNVTVPIGAFVIGASNVESGRTLESGEFVFPSGTFRFGASLKAPCVIK